MPSEEEDESEDENLDEDALLDASVRHAFQYQRGGSALTEVVVEENALGEQTCPGGVSKSSCQSGAKAPN